MKSKFLLDTDIIIWHLRGQAKTKELFYEIQEAGIPACSALTIVEVQQGIRKGEEKKTNLLLDSLNIYPVDKDIANKAGQLIRDYKKKGKHISIPDAIIAATCIVNNMILITYNLKDYPMPELKIYPAYTWS